MGTKVKVMFDSSNHEIYGSCSVNYKNQYWIFGGAYDRRKVSTVENCLIKRQAIELPEIGIN